MSLLKKTFSKGKGSNNSKTDSKKTTTQPPSNNTPQFFYQDFRTSYHGWMMFPVESISKMSAGFADVKSLYKLAKRVYLTQTKIALVPGSDRCVVRAEERFVVVRPKKVKLERPVMAAQMDTVIGMMVLREQNACVIMTYAENTHKKASVGADVLVFDDKNLNGFIQAFNKCLSLRNKLPVRRRAISEDVEDDVASMVIDIGDGDDTSYLEMNHQHRPASSARGSVSSDMSFVTGGYINIQLDGDDIDDPEPGYLTVLTSGQRNDGLGYLICST